MNSKYTLSPTVSAGFTFQFLVLMTFLFWLLHIIHIWISIVFPHAAKKLKKRDKYIHITTVLVVVAISLIGPVVAAAKFPYIVPRLPVLTCFSSDVNWTFYSLILPCSIILAIASTLLILLFNTTYKVSINDCVRFKSRSLRTIIIQFYVSYVFIYGIFETFLMFT